MLRLIVVGVMPLRLVVGELLGPPSVGLADRRLQRLGHGVGVEDAAAVDIAGSAADGLHQRGLRAQIALLVGIEDGDEAAFGDVEALAQQVDADQHVELAEPEIADDLDALERVDVGVQVADPDALLVQVLREILGHPLGQGGHQHAQALLAAVAAFGQEVVDLVLDRPDDDHGIDQAGGSDHLLDEDAARPLQLPGSGRRRDEDRLRPHHVPFLELQGRLSTHDGSRKPNSASVDLRCRSPLYMPPTCGTATWLSSTKRMACSGMYSNRVGGGSPGLRPVR